MYISFPHSIAVGHSGQMWFKLFFARLLSAQLVTMIQGLPHDLTVVQSVSKVLNKNNCWIYTLSLLSLP